MCIGTFIDSCACLTKAALWHSIHCGLVTPYDDIDLAQVMAFIQAIPWNDIESSPMGFCGVHLRAM